MRQQATEAPLNRQRRPRPGAKVVVIGDPIDHDRVAGLCARVRRELDGCDAGTLVCDVTRVERPDATTIDLLARLALTARRCGRGIELRHASAPLRDMLDLAGLTDAAGLRLEAERQPEEREEVLRVQEERDAIDPVP